MPVRRLRMVREDWCFGRHAVCATPDDCDTCKPGTLTPERVEELLRENDANAREVNRALRRMCPLSR